MRDSCKAEGLLHPLLDLVWDQWATLGVASERRHRGPSAIDLEALILLTLELGRSEPRLFDEMLDWLHHNSHLISTSRLTALCADDTDRRLVDATLAWLATQGRGARRAVRRERPRPATPEILFYGASAPRDADDSFAALGFLRPRVQPSGKSASPDLLAPQCLTLRLRTILAAGAKSEVASALLTINAPRVQMGVLTASVGLTTRPVREALSELTAAGVVDRVSVGASPWFRIDRERWAAWLSADVENLPTHTEWPQLSAAFRLLVRWLNAPDGQDATPYLRASAARSLWSEIEPWLRFAGVYLPSVPFSAGEAYLDEFNAALGAVSAHARQLAGPR